MTARNRLKKEAHDLANELWEYGDYAQRKKMYVWLSQNRHKFNGHCHIRHMGENELRHLINILLIKITEKRVRKMEVKIKNKKSKRKKVWPTLNYTKH